MRYVAIEESRLPPNCSECCFNAACEDAYGYDIYHYCPAIYKGYTDEYMAKGTRHRECPLILVDGIQAEGY